MRADDRETKICNEQDLVCHSQAIDTFRQIYLINKTHVQKMFHGCNCLPTCSHVSYGATFLNFNYAFEKSHNLTSLKVSYKDAQFLALQRIEKYTMIDVLVWAGGILGLYLGGSLLSVIDLVFYCTAREIFTFIRHKKNKNTLSMQRKQLAIKKHTAVICHR